MKRSIYYAILMAIALAAPQFTTAQVNLNGIWRLKEFKKITGPDYTNTLPLTVVIEQKSGIIRLEATISNGDRDTMIKESLTYGEKSTNESRTITGKKRIISFKMNQDGSWFKQTEIFAKDDPTRLQSVDKQTFAVYENGNSLNIFRKYDGNDDPEGNQDFMVEGNYEKFTSEQLAKETAKGKGVNFVEGINWEQIKAKAKVANKMIFVDCYATWCVPCKMMDRNVYPLNIVGEAMNDQFIAVKIQMDSTKKDPATVKLLYSLARQFERDYGISALPSYLFFSADGTLVHKAIGQQDAKKFIELLNNAKKPESQLYTLLNKARKKELPWTEYPVIAGKLRNEFGEKKLAEEVAGIYNQEYLNKLSEKNLLTKTNLDFIGEYYGMVKSSDKVFLLSLKYPHLVDSIKEYEGGGWADVLVKRTITREEIEPFLREAEKLNNEPDWARIQQQLTKKYNKELAINYVLYTRVDWYERKKDWVSFLQYVSPYMARYNISKMKPMELQHLHYCVYYVFKYSKEPALMNKALGWINSAIEVWINQSTLADGPMDTKAMLLYKMGRKDEAITLEKKIISMFPQFKNAYQNRLDKMLKGEEM